MTRQATRRARILRVRAIEHRAATAHLATADAAVANLLRIAGRLVALRRSLVADRDDSLGLTLNAKAEMSQRLDDATASLSRPIYDAEQARFRVNSERLIARRREESAARLHDRAVQFDEQSSDERASALQPFRKHSNRLGDSA
jgi:hypothetical protein